MVRSVTKIKVTGSFPIMKNCPGGTIPANSKTKIPPEPNKKFSSIRIELFYVKNEFGFTCCVVCFVELLRGKNPTWLRSPDRGNEGLKLEGHVALGYSCEPELQPFAQTMALFFKVSLTFSFSHPKHITAGFSVEVFYL